MNTELYFLPMISAALRAPDRTRALRECFEEIMRLGATAEFSAGFGQFRLWLTHVQDACGIAIRLERGTAIHGEARLFPGGDWATFRGVLPGLYTLRLGMGRVLWRAELYAENLLLERGPKAQPLRLAAATKPDEQRATREDRILDGELVVRVLPGLESGTLGVRIP